MFVSFSLEFLKIKEEEEEKKSKSNEPHGYSAANCQGEVKETGYIVPFVSRSTTCKISLWC